MYYFYSSSNRGHGNCPLYRGCPPFGGYFIRGVTVEFWLSDRTILTVSLYTAMSHFVILNDYMYMQLCW